jgi:hypothetical protein
MKLNDTSKELFAKIRGRFPTVAMGNQTAEVTNDPNAARFFDFDFKAGDKVLGKVSISISEQDGLVVIHSADLSQTEDLVARENWFSFLKELRQFAKSRMMTFDTRDITKSNLEKRDYNFLSNMSQPKEVTEAALTGTNKTSFQNIGSSKLIIKHSAPVDEDFAAGRTHKIHAIYVENTDGERFKYPFKHINGARAMARHVSEGGKPYDDFGKHIVGLSEELAKLRKFKNYVNRSSVMAETLKEYSQVINDRIEEIKGTIQGLQKESFYKLTKENFKANETLTVPEDVKENWIDQLTIKTFNNELQEVFPYIYKLVTQKSIKEITAEDIDTEATGYQGSTETRNLKYNVQGDFDRSRPVSDKDAFTIQDLLKKNGIESEVTPDEGNYQGVVIYTNAAPQSVEKVLGNMIETVQNPIEQFEKILDSIIDEGENTLFSSDSEEQKQALEKLNLLMKNHFPAGVNGVNGLESLEGIIDDPNLNDQIRELGKKDSDTCIRPLIMAYIQDKKPDMVKRISTGDMKMSTEGNQFAQAVQKAKAAGMKPGDKFKVGDKEFTLKDAIEQAGMQLETFFGENSNNYEGSFEYELYGDDGETAYGKIHYKAVNGRVDPKSLQGDYEYEGNARVDSDLATQMIQPGGDEHDEALKAAQDDYNYESQRVKSVEQPVENVSIDDEYRFRDWLKKTHNKQVHELKPQEYAIISKQYRDQEELAKEIWNNTPALHDEYKDWKEYMDSEDFQMDSDKLRSKFESTGGGANIRQMNDLELANFLNTTVAEVKKDREAAEEAAMELNQKYANSNESSKQDLHKGTTKVEELVKSFYDYTTNKFPKGETAVITAVQKLYGDDAAKTAIETIKTLQSGQNKEIERIKQLAGYSAKN